MMLWEIIKWFGMISLFVSGSVLLRGIVVFYWPWGRNRAVERKGDEDVRLRD